MDVTKDGRTWRVGTAAEVAWIAGRPHGFSITTAIPPVFDAYAVVDEPDDGNVGIRERALIDELNKHTPGQPWWLGFLATGAHDIVFPRAPKVALYWDWRYVLVEAGPVQALAWRTGHMRSSDGTLPDLFFPADRSWLVSALWDDTWHSIGGSAELIDTLCRSPMIKAHQIGPDDDALPPGAQRD